MAVGNVARYLEKTMKAELLTKTNEELLTKMFRCLLQNSKNLSGNEYAYDDEVGDSVSLKDCEAMLLRLEDKS